MIKTESFRRALIPIGILFIIFNLPLLAGPFLRLADYHLPLWVTLHLLPLVYLWHFVSLVLFLTLMVGKVFKLPFLTMEWLMRQFDTTREAMESITNHPKYVEYNKQRRQMVRRTLTVMTGAFAIGSGLELYKKDTFEKTIIAVPVKNLPMSFDGYSIGFLSDIHSGTFMSEERMRRYAETVNSLQADMIVVTGDFVNSDLDEVYPLRDAFKILTARDGVFGVLGNHDYYTRRVDQVASEIENAGIQLLRNKNIKIHLKGDELELAGIDDTGRVETAMRYFHDATDGGKKNIARLLLCHRPYFFKEAAESGYDLVLSGHTHGGQVVFGELGKDVIAPARIISPYVAGLYTHSDSRMYVSRGIGTVGVPFRFNCPPEITKIVLRREV